MPVAFAIKRSTVAASRDRNMNDIKENDIKEYANVFDGIKPFSGPVPKGYMVDFLGTLTDARFRTIFGVDPGQVGGGVVSTVVPTIADGEGWFEAVNWGLPPAMRATATPW